MKVITLNNKDFLNGSQECITLIDFKPDVVFQILNGGGYLGGVMAVNELFIGIPFVNVKVQRSAEGIKSSIVFKCLMKLLPYWVLDKLRILESAKAIKTRRGKDLVALSKTNINLGYSLGQSVKNILIVDDAIDTGKTMFLVKSNLKRQYPNANIKIAVLSWTLEDSIVKPDFYVYKNVLIRFPWSKDYKGKDFEEKSISC